MPKKYVRKTTSVRAPRTPKIAMLTLNISERAEKRREQNRLSMAKHRKKSELQGPKNRKSKGSYI